MLSKSAFLIGDLPTLQVAHLVGMAALDEHHRADVRVVVQDQIQPNRSIL